MKMHNQTITVWVGVTPTEHGRNYRDAELPVAAVVNLTRKGYNSIVYKKTVPTELAIDKLKDFVQNTYVHGTDKLSVKVAHVDTYLREGIFYYAN